MERERESSEARQIQWRNPPSSQMNITASRPPSLPPSFPACLSASPPPPVAIDVFFPLLSSPPTPPSPRRLHYSLPLLRDPGALGPSCRRHRYSSLHILQSSPGCSATLPVCRPLPPPSLRPHSSFCPFTLPPRHGDSEQAPLCRWEGERAVVQPLSRLLTGGTLEERIFLSVSALEESCSPAASICAIFNFFLTSRPILPPPLGLQFWLCVGTRKRGPKCLKPITCSRCRGVISRCVTLLLRS